MSSLRQRTASSNIANINTPNYKVNKVEFKIPEAAGIILLLRPQMKIYRAKNAEPVISKRKVQPSMRMKQCGH